MTDFWQNGGTFFASGYSSLQGVILRHDGGTTWTSLPIGAVGRLNTMRGAGNHLITAGANGTVGHSVDNGASWLFATATDFAPAAMPQGLNALSSAWVSEGEQPVLVGDTGAILQLAPAP